MSEQDQEYIRGEIMKIPDNHTYYFICPNCGGTIDGHQLAIDDGPFITPCKACKKRYKIRREDQILFFDEYEGK